MIQVPVETCPLCGADSKCGMFYGNFRVAFNPPENETRLDVIYYMCTKCGLFYQDPRCDVEYQQEYRLWTHTTFKFTDQEEMINETKRAMHITDYIGFALPAKPTSLLDIGSSLGCLPAFCRMRFDCDVAGVEPNDEYRRRAKSANKVDLVASIKDLPDKDFDLITCSHTLEHVVDPHAFVEEFPVPSQPGPFPKVQHLILEVPYSYSMSWSSMWHYTGWTKATLKRLFWEHGWSGPDHVDIHAWPTFHKPDTCIQMHFWR